MKVLQQLAAFLLAAGFVFALTACAKEAQETITPEEEVVGTDWRTYGWVNGAGTVTRGEETTDVLVCIFTDEAVFYYDDAVQTVYDAAVYPEPIEDAQSTFASVSFDDRNGDGDSDVQLIFVQDDGTQTELVWYWDAENGFVFQTDDAPAEIPAQERGM